MPLKNFVRRQLVGQAIGIATLAVAASAAVPAFYGVFNQVLQVPSVRQAISGAQAADIIGGSPQQFDAFIKSELNRWPEVVKAAGIKVE